VHPDKPVILAGFPGIHPGPLQEAGHGTIGDMDQRSVFDEEMGYGSGRTRAGC
jgi:hypothetical protein